MSPELWNRVKTILAGALEKDPDEWRAYLRQTCKGDRKLRNEVESLLAVSWSIGDFIEEPALEMLRRELTRT